MTDPRQTRRRLLTAAAGALVDAGMGTAAPAPGRHRTPVQQAAREPRPEVREFAPSSIRVSASERAAVLHLLRRTTFGPTPGQVDEVARLGRAAWLDQQLSPASVADSDGDLITSKYPKLSMTSLEARAAFNNGSWDLMDQTCQATLARAAWSRRQLFEVMVDFWSNHLNVTCPSSEVWDNRHLYDRDVIRKHALGNFADMLVASAEHPAMLRYLDQTSSTAAAPNENYGRELLELHTVGIEAGYTETEVRHSAYIMTGYRISGTTYRFEYSSSRHWVGKVSVLGFTDPNTTRTGGYDVAKRYLNYLARHPRTATRLATKLAQRFVADAPPAALVERLAAVYLANDTAIVPVLRALFASPEFLGSAGQKMRRPYEDLIATVRALGIRPPAADRADWSYGIRALYWMSGDVGHAPLGWHPPNGYPDVAGAWQSASGLLGRWNAHTLLATGWWPKQEMLTFRDLRATFLPTLPWTYGALVDVLAPRLLNQPLTSEQRALVLGWCGRSAGTAVRGTDDVLTWRFPLLVSLLLSTPCHEMR